jgi:thioredoxin-related protein
MVNGLERELGERAVMIKLNVSSAVGREAVYRYAVRVLPTFVVLDGDGRVLLKREGIASKAELLQALP